MKTHKENEYSNENHIEDASELKPMLQDNNNTKFPIPVNMLMKKTSFKSSSYYKKVDEHFESETDTDVNLSSYDLLISDENRIVPKSNVKDPQFEARPSDRLVRFGETVKFFCKVNGTRPLEVFWFKMNGDELTNDEKYEMYHDDEFFYLKIYNTVQRDNGMYLCVISNDTDQNLDSFYLKLRGLFSSFVILSYFFIFLFIL